MSAVHSASPVTDELARLLTLEDALAALLATVWEAMAQHPEAAAAHEHATALARTHAAALRARLAELGAPAPAAAATAVPAISPLEADPTASSALQDCYAALNRAAFGYTIAHARLHRYFDRASADLAEGHLKAHAQAALALNQLISNVVVWELAQAGQECQCRCPGCGLGLCVCAPHGAETVNAAWRFAGPAVPTGGLLVRPPRAGSPAAEAGIHAGDTVIGLDDQPVETHADVQRGVGAHAAGEPVRLRVRRGDATLEITAIRR
jgi:C-terminal processing protease CtpA/Prc